jgi:hypothetical protein
MTRPLLLGAVAYDPKVVPIWEGFQRFFAAEGLPFDVVLYTNYERQVEAHLGGHVDVAWSSPLAWIQVDRAARARGRAAHAIAMRDTDRDLLALLWFLHAHAPDPVTREVARLAAQDEARHVAFGMAHLGRHASLDPALLGRLAAAVTRRHEALRSTAGLNAEVFDALVILAAGSWEEDAIAAAHDAVVALGKEMDEGRRKRLRKLGFGEAEAGALSALHTRNFM